jgi:uncharacterized protein YvpB
MIFIFLILCIRTFSQQIQYTYDDAGNRVKREFILLETVEKNQPEQNSDDSLAYQENKTIQATISEMVVSVYPNPIKSSVKVYITNLQDNTGSSLTVFDLSGREIISKKPVESVNELSLYDQPPGQYLLRLELKNEKKEWGIIKQ